MRGYPHFSFWILTAFAMICFFKKKKKTVQKYCCICRQILQEIRISRDAQKVCAETK